MEACILAGSSGKLGDSVSKYISRMIELAFLIIL